MAVTVIGGLTTSTLLTLVVVPVAYTLLDDLLHPSRWRLAVWLRGRRGKAVAVPRPGGLHCPVCTYDLTGNVSGVCPECGSTVPYRPEYASIRS
jgi:hypothetical protein